VAELTEIAEAAGKPTPSITLHAVRPDPGVIGHYASMGVERAVLILPPLSDALPMVREWASLVTA
jgi:hypothetical protein